MDRIGSKRDDGQTRRRRTRITVEPILEKLAAGETVEQILDAHPRLSREAIQAALAFAKEVLRADVIYPVAEAVG
jgi:uncharacterized protein (DUF433 family)